MSIDPALRELLRPLVDELVEQKLAALKGRSAPELLTIGAAAKAAHLSKKTVARWIGSGRLAAIGEGRTTRIRRADLERAIGPRRAVAAMSPLELADQHEPRVSQ